MMQGHVECLIGTASGLHENAAENLLQYLGYRGILLSLSDARSGTGSPMTLIISALDWSRSSSNMRTTVAVDCLNNSENIRVRDMRDGQALCKPSFCYWRIQTTGNSEMLPSLQVILNIKLSL